MNKINKEYRELETLANLLKCDYGISNALDLILLVTNSKNMENIKQLLNNGITLSDAILQQEYNKSFLNYFRFFVAANDIAYAITRAIEICSKQTAIIEELKQKTRYPAFLIVFLILFLLFVSIFLMPQVESLLHEFTTSISTMQQIIFTLFKVVPAILIIIFVFLAGCVFIICYSISKNRFDIQQKLLKISISSQIIKKYYSLSFALLYNELLKNGYDVSESLQFMLDNTKNHPLQPVIYELYQYVESGCSFIEAVAKVIYFEKLFISYLTICIYVEKENKDIDNYIQLSIENIQILIQKIISITLPSTYIFIGTFVITVYLSIIIPLMDVINTF